MNGSFQSSQVMHSFFSQIDSLFKALAAAAVSLSCTRSGAVVQVMHVIDVECLREQRQRAPNCSEANCTHMVPAEICSVAHSKRIPERRLSLSLSVGPSTNPDDSISVIVKNNNMFNVQFIRLRYFLFWVSVFRFRIDKTSRCSALCT